MNPASTTPPTQSTHGDSILKRLLSRVAYHKRISDASDTVSFIEAIQSFHTDDCPFTAAPRTARVYKHLRAQYDTLLNAIESIISDARIEYNTDSVAVSVRDKSVTRLYQQLGINQSVVFEDLILRVARSFQVMAANPEPSIQALFMTDLPIELLVQIVSYLDNATMLSLSVTCRGLRAICLDQLPPKAFFRMKYDMSMIHTPSAYNRESLRLAALKATIDSRDEAIKSTIAFEAHSFLCKTATFASFENEWDTQWPPYMEKSMLAPSALDSHVFKPFYSRIAALLVAMPALTHIRLLSLALSGEIVDFLAGNRNITHLTVIRYTVSPMLLVSPGLHNTLPHLTYLGIGFHGDHFLHRQQWCLMTLCPSLRQIYAYSIDCRNEGATVRFPFSFDGLHQIHHLETLHIHGSTCFIESLVQWMRSAAKTLGGPGRLRRLKLYTRMGLYHEDVLRLVDVLRDHHPHITTLIFDGIHSIPTQMLSYIRDHLPTLSGLSLVCRASRNRRESSLYCWDEPVYAYARAMEGFHNLRHLELNVLWSPMSLSPFAIKILVATSHGQRPDEATSVSDAVGETMIPTSCLGSAVARPFASACRSLESFALRAGECLYSTRITRRPEHGFDFVDVRSDTPHTRFGNWNPYDGNTW